MKTHTVRLFRKQTDDDPSEEWAVIAESPEEAKRLLREQWAGKWWQKVEVATAEPEVSGPAEVLGRIQDC